jgi:hypothetical protein
MKPRRPNPIPVSERDLAPREEFSEPDSRMGFGRVGGGSAMKGGKERSAFSPTVYTTIARDKTSDAQKERRFCNFSKRNGRIVKLLLYFYIYYNYNKKDEVLP